MGVGKLKVKRIENAVNRQVTFFKRRGGLVKKAHELAILCDAQVAVVIFSSSGRLFEYASSSSMVEILERYRRQLGGYASQASNTTDTNIEYWGRKAMKLQEDLEILHKTNRHMQGEDLHLLEVEGLKRLEQQLTASLARVRLKKEQFLLNEIETLRRNVNHLQRINCQSSSIMINPSLPET